MKHYTQKILASFLVVSILFLVTLTDFEVKAFQQVTFRNGSSEGAFTLYEPSAVQNSSPGRADVNLDWENYTFDIAGDEVGSNFLTVRRPIYYDASGNNVTHYGNWDIRGNYGATIKVLSIYPNRTEAAGLKTWMDNQSKKNDNVDIQVTSQSQNSFNSDPYKYLKRDSNGMYNYDVIVFGFWDEHNKAKLTSSSANIIQTYINSGYGVIFGHDVVQNIPLDRGFNSLVQNNLDIFLTPVDRSMWYASDKISVRKQGSLTTYPFDINGMDLTIPRTHTLAQLPGNSKTGVPNDDIVYMTLEANYYPSEGDGPYFQYYFLTSAKGPETTIKYKHGSNPEYEYIANGYLLKQDNVAFIQAGHKSGETSEAEQMVLANLIYSLAQISGETGGQDQILDDAKPAIPTDNNGDLVFESTDYGVGYEYRIIAMPIGYDSSILDKEKVSEALSKNVDRFNDNVLFSNSYISSNLVARLKGSNEYQGERDQATYRYYIDKNPNGTRIPTVEIPGNENLNDDFYTLSFNEPFDYSRHFTSVSKIADDDFLHVVAYDRANNASKVGNFKIKNILPKGDITINCIYDGNIIKSETKLGTEDASLLIGSQYSSTPQKNLEIDGVKYVYSSSQPNSYITIGEENVINHIYNKLVTKDVYLVEVRPEINGDNYSKTKTIFLTETLEVGTNIIIKNNIPDLSDQNLNYVGWSQGTDGDYSNYLTEEEFTWTDDDDNIYLYYEKETATVEINVVRSDGQEFEPGISSYTYSKEGFVGEILTITGSDIKSKISVKNSVAFSNKSILQNYYKEFLLKDSMNYSDTITLEPRTINIFGVGIDYGNETTTSSAITREFSTEDKAVSMTKNIFSVTRTYDQDLVVEELAPPNVIGSEDGSIWKNFYDDENGQIVTIDFSNNRDMNIGYYRGIKPNEAYSVEANFINVIPDDNNVNNPLSATYTSGTLNVATSANIPVKDTMSISGIVEGRDVEFELDYFEVIYDGNTTVYESSIDLNNIVPIRDDTGAAQIGEYIVNIYYRPYARVIYTEKVYDVTGNEVLSSKTTKYDVPYDDVKKSLKPSQPVDQYNIFIDGNAEYDEGAEKISTTVNDYQYEVTTKYTPKVYNLEIEIIEETDPTGTEKVINNINLKNQTIYIFKNIPVKNNIEFMIPNYENSNYYFQDAELVSNSELVGDFSYGDDKKRIIFKPDKDIDIDGKSYKMNLNYRLLADIIGNIKIFRFNQSPLIEDIFGDAFIGDEVVVKIPATEGFVLTNAYLDGVEHTNIETGKSYNLLVKKPAHYINLIYRQQKYTLNVESKTGGGTISGEGNYYENERVYIKVTPDDGYKLEKLVVDGAIVDLAEEEGTVGYYYFDMPNVNFNIYAYFAIDNDYIDDIDSKPYIPTEPDDSDDDINDNDNDESNKEDLEEPNDNIKEDLEEPDDNIKEDLEKPDDSIEEKEDDNNSQIENPVEDPREDENLPEEKNDEDRVNVDIDDENNSNDNLISEPIYTVVKGNDNVYYVFDENGVPLGTISEEDYLLGNFDNLIPFGYDNIPEEAKKIAETFIKENPKTYSNTSISLGVGGILLFIFTVIIFKNRKEIK